MTVDEQIVRKLILNQKREHDCQWNFFLTFAKRAMKIVLVKRCFCQTHFLICYYICWEDGSFRLTVWVVKIIWKNIVLSDTLSDLSLPLVWRSFYETSSLSIGNHENSNYCNSRPKQDSSLRWWTAFFCSNRLIVRT